MMKNAWLGTVHLEFLVHLVVLRTSFHFFLQDLCGNQPSIRIGLERQLTAQSGLRNQFPLLTISAHAGFAPF